MSAILSEAELNDFITPGAVCIKPVETLPSQPQDQVGIYEVTTEDRLAATQAPPAQITLTDCLACSGCVTSAETVLVSEQSHTEALRSLNRSPSYPPETIRNVSAHTESSHDLSANGLDTRQQDGTIFVASISPQVRASLAAAYGISDQQAGWMVEHVLCGQDGIARMSRYGNQFMWVIDTNAMREVCLSLEYETVTTYSQGEDRKTPLITSACPGWVCFVEKGKHHALPHLSTTKSPQALTGTIVKSVLSAKLGIHPSQIWHMAIMPCPDKKLEAARSELTDKHWASSQQYNSDKPVRDVDCVITTNDLLMLAHESGISLPSVSTKPISPLNRIPFPDPRIDEFLFSQRWRRNKAQNQAAGTSGSYLHYILNQHLSNNPGSELHQRQVAGKRHRAGWLEYVISQSNSHPKITRSSKESMDTEGEVIFRAARCYGFHNIQNLVRDLAPPEQHRLLNNNYDVTDKTISATKRDFLLRKAAKKEGKDAMTKRLDYIEVMACPGGCTGGGGQIQVSELNKVQGKPAPTASVKEWLAVVDEAYYSMSDSDTGSEHEGNIESGEESLESQVDGVSQDQVRALIDHWEKVTGISRNKLLYTSYHAVESDVGKISAGSNQSAMELASKAGGW